MDGTILHAIEKKIIVSLKSDDTQSLDRLAESAGISIDQARRGVEWLRHKGLADVYESEEAQISLDKNGMDLPDGMLPERRLLQMLAGGGPQTVSALIDALGPSLFGAAIGMARKNGWVVARPGKTGDDMILSASPSLPALLPGEATLAAIQRNHNAPIAAASVDMSDLQSLLKRPRLVKRTVVRTKSVTLAASARKLDVSSDDTDAKERPGAIDVSANVQRMPLGRTHPLKEIISEIREIFAAMGFSEISGSIVQSCFWNFDALLTPQDHPSREMQDTFYLDDDMVSNPVQDSSPGHVRYIARTHAAIWRQKWDAAEAERMVLRTHTTCVTLRHLLSLSSRLDNARVFSLGRVFRNEKTSYKHLAEFTQVEGVVHEEGTTIRDLMGIQTEFYRRLGLPKVKFWPTFFPYTEPSFQSMVYNERLGKWVELFGMGIFHPHVTRGLAYPVLAWGGGVERIAMLRYGVDDVRDFYANDMQWLRSMR